MFLLRGVWPKVGEKKATFLGKETKVLHRPARKIDILARDVLGSALLAS